MEARMQTRLGLAAEANHSAGEFASTAHKHWNALRFPSAEFPPATPLFFQGGPAREVFWVERGLIKLIHLGEDGEELIVGLRSKGDLLGAASVIVGESHQVTAITIAGCSLSRLPAQLFLRLVKTDEQFCWYLHQVHSREVHQQASQIMALRYLSARQRFERLLLQFLSSMSPHEKQASMKIRLPLKHWEIAQLIGITPEHLSRVLKQIKQEGILHEEAGHLIVPDIRKIQGQDD